MSVNMQETSRLDATKVLVLINIIIFAAMVISSGPRSLLIPPQDLLVRWGANLGAFTVNGQYWRLLTSMFVHANIMHVGLNMYALWVFGPTVSKTFGTGRFLAIYFISGLAGALASMVWNPAQTSAGASGALVGIAGAMLAVLVRGGEIKEPDSLKPKGSKKAIDPEEDIETVLALDDATGLSTNRETSLSKDHETTIPAQNSNTGSSTAAAPMTEADLKRNRILKPLVFFGVICASLLYGFFDPAMDNAAHVGGLFGGFLSGLALQPAKEGKGRLSPLVQVFAFCVAVLSVSIACVMEAKADKRSANYQIAARAFEDLKALKFERAYDGYDELLKSELNSTYFVGRAKSLIGLKRYKLAIEDCGRAIAINPHEPDGYMNRALALHDQGDDIEAIEDLSFVVEKFPRQRAKALNARSWNEVSLGRLKNALEDADASLKLEPDNPDTLDTRGMVYLCLKKSEKALLDFERSISLRPEQGASYFHRALIYDQTGAKALAEGDRAKAKAINYEPDPWELRLQQSL